MHRAEKDGGMPPVSIRALSAAMSAAALASVVLLLAAMCLYPGGTQWDHAAPGNDFWQNYVCDLARTVALDGVPNPRGSALAQAAMALLALALGLLWWLVPRVFPARRLLGATVRVAGCTASAAALAVVLLPADRFSQVHGLSIVVAGVPGLAAGFLAVVGLAQEERAPRVAAALGGAAFVVALGAFVLYVRQYFVPGPGPIAGAVLERIALLLLIVWMGAVAWRSARAEAWRPYDPPRPPRPTA
jgi:hypothetical protein